MSDPKLLTKQERTDMAAFYRSFTKDSSGHTKMMRVFATMDALVARLRQIEWNRGQCLACLNLKPAGHLPGCTLAALLREVD